MRFSSLGDVVLATAAVEALHAERPGIAVHVLTKPAFRDVFRGHPGVARIVNWQPEDGLGALSRRLRLQGYDWIVDLHANLRTRVLRLLVPGAHWSVYRKGALRRRVAVGLRRPGWLDAGSHVVDRYLAALQPLGVSGDRWLPRVVPGAEAEARTRALLVEQGCDPSDTLLALAPAARWATKAWPRERWVELLRSPEIRALGTPVLIGGSEEQGLCGEILGNAGSGGVNLAGSTSIRETAAALSLCRALVTNDSAPLHLATAVRTPVVALFGPTHRDFGFHPLGPRDVLLERDEPCRPCSLHGDPECPQGHHRCLDDISAAEVSDAVVDLLGVRGAPDNAGEDRQPAGRGAK